MGFKLEFSVRNFWIGAYWERWEKTGRLDLWIAPLPFVVFHFWTM